MSDEKNQVVVGVPENASPWVEWLAVVGPEERNRVAELFKKHDVEDSDGFVSFCQDMIAEVFRGSLHPKMVEAVMPILQHMFAGLAIKHQRNPMAGDSMRTEMTARIIELKKSMTPIAPTYTVAHLPDKVLDAVEVK